MLQRHSSAVRERFDVLIVEDDRALCDQIGVALGDEGFSFTSAHDGRAALEVLRRADVRLVILDLMLPSLSGPQVFEAMRCNEALAEIPVVMITAVSNVHTAPPGPVYTKPIRRESLVRAVRLHLGRTTAERRA